MVSFFLENALTAYHELVKKHAELCYALSHRIFELESDWYNGHYHKDYSGKWQEMKENIQASDETEIGISFVFPFDTEGTKIFEFVKLLRHEGFYY